jgi:16S rRNA U516 pseudouridylate synthase RsuA-like enzyme
MPAVRPSHAPSEEVSVSHPLLDPHRRNTTGLLLLCGDGELTHLLLRPGFLSKTYVGGFTAPSPPTASQLHQLEQGVMLNDGLAIATAVSVVGREPVPLPAHLQGSVPQSSRYDVRVWVLHPNPPHTKNRHARRG